MTRLVPDRAHCVGSVGAGVPAEPSHPPLLCLFTVSIGVPILMLLAALILGFIGWFGMPNGYRRLPDYIRSYQENKQRYKWKW